MKLVFRFSVLFFLLLGGLLQTSAAQELNAYRISPGDVISIIVFDEPELTLRDARVPSSGSISFPFIGEVRLAGETTQAVERDMVERLAEGYLRHPQVTVSIAQYRPFFVGGSVNVPGQKQFGEGMTVAKAIALAGGVRDDSPIDAINIERPGQKLFGVIGMTTDVMPGDIITITTIARASASHVSQYIYLYGEVRSPGRYQFEDGLTVEKAIALAGGFGQRASRRKITVTREDEESINKAGLRTEIKPEDVITVGASLF